VTYFVSRAILYKKKHARTDIFGANEAISSSLNYFADRRIQNGIA